MFHAVRGYKYYIPLKRRAILTLQMFCCRKINGFDVGALPHHVGLQPRRVLPDAGARDLLPRHQHGLQGARWNYQHPKYTMNLVTSYDMRQIFWSLPYRLWRRRGRSSPSRGPAAKTGSP